MTGAAPRLRRPKTKQAQTGIVHLGLGAFFRAFGCPYIADAMAAGGDWGVVGVSLRRPDIRDALQEQEWAYTAMSLTPDGPVPRVIDVLNDVLVATENPDTVLNVMADPATRIVTLTVTEKGYCHHPASGALNFDHPDIVHDLAHDSPKSAIGFIVKAMQRRRAAGVRPFTVLSCDNMPENGVLLRGLALAFAKQSDPDIAAWIAAEARFPSTMVDRITPATTPEDIAHVTKLTGYFDAAPVMHEPFAQWVIEDDFVGNDSPDFASAGAELVNDVSVYEDMKLRMLNGTHSALAYSGYLAGHQTVFDVASDPVFEAFANSLWAEIIPTINAPDGVDLSDYAAALFARYANPNIRHLTWQIAMDGSQKLPQRILGTLFDTFATGRSAPMLCLAVAAWMRYVTGVDENGAKIDVQDPLADRLRRLTDHASGPEGTVAALLGVTDIFSPDMADRLRDPVTAAAVDIWALGVRAAISKAL